MAMTTEPLDLVDIAVLLNYERATTDDRFRNTKLREIAFPGWDNNERTWIVLEEDKTQEERQLPATIRNEHGFLSLPLGDQRLETVFYRIHAYDSCASTTLLLEDFFKLFPQGTELRFRHAPKGKRVGSSYITSIHNRSIIRDKLVNSKFSTILAAPQNNHVKFTGTEPEMAHWYTAFYAPGSDEFTSVLELASMRFGDIGRGPGEKGKMLIVLDTKADYDKRLLKVADDVDLAQRKVTPIIMSTYEATRDRIARKVEERWEKRGTEKWCAHCGAPEPQFKCGACGNVWFCNKEHQKMVWSFHKGYCNKS